MAACAGRASSAGPTARSTVGSPAAPSSGSPDADMPGRSTAGDCRGIRNHAPLARRCRGIRKPGPAPLVCADRSWPGSSVVHGWRRLGGRCTVVLAPSAVTDRLWTVGGRELDCCRSPCRGDPRCCCVRVCQSPVLIPGLWRAARLFPSAGGCRCRRWPGARRCCTSAFPGRPAPACRHRGPLDHRPGPAGADAGDGGRGAGGEGRNETGAPRGFGGVCRRTVDKQWRWCRCCRWNRRRSECPPTRNRGSCRTDIVAW